MPVKIAIYSAFPELEASAIELAERLHLPLAVSQSELYDYLLVLTHDYLGLQKTNSTALPLYVDFLRGKMNYRAQHTSIKNEALARAMGLKGNTHPKIVDATGGLAGDSFTLASLGFEVTMLERSTIMYVLVEDGIRRARKDPSCAAILNRMQLVQTDAKEWLQDLKVEQRPDIIYLDPMFPERKKSAQPKQKMLMLHDIVGEDRDAEGLLQAALTCAVKRVVVKRPRLAALLAVSPAPSFTLSGSSSRFDVYIR